MRKGIMFSVIVFFLAVTLVGLIAIQRGLIAYRREQMYVETRINAINSHYESVIRDLGKTIEGSAQRAIFACINNISYIDAVPLTDVNFTIAELILNGTFHGREESMMYNATIPYWIQQIEDISTLRGFEVDIDTGMINSTLVVKPYSSFYLMVEADIGINITDIQGVSALNRTTQIKKKVSIEGLEDPLYYYYFKGPPTNVVWESPYVGNYTQRLLTGTNGNDLVYGNATKTGSFSGKILVVDNANGMDLSGAIGVISVADFPNPSIPFVEGVSTIDDISEGQHILLDGSNLKVWYIENLKKHMEGVTPSDHSYYQASEKGPSFLDRLEKQYEVQTKYDDQSDEIIGLESFVDKTIFPGGFTPVQERTNIDYLYFSSSTTGDRVKEVSDSNWFRIDNELAIGSIRHHEIYNVTQLIE